MPAAGYEAAALLAAVPADFTSHREIPENLNLYFIVHSRPELCYIILYVQAALIRSGCTAAAGLLCTAGPIFYRKANFI